MAMIQCPNCEKAISDKAKKCIHCGHVLVEEEKKICPECGNELEAGANICSNCGCPIEENLQTPEQNAPQQVEVTGVKVTQKSKKRLCAIIGGILILALVLLAGQQVKKQNAIKAEQERSSLYLANLQKASVLMLSGASDAEECGNLIKHVWANAIYEDRDPETDPYTRPKGYFVDDFNDALQNLFIDNSFSKRIETIKSNQNDVQAIMKELKNPPEEYEDAYESITDFYNAYSSLTGMATNPTGSLQTFSSNFNDADSATLNCYKAFELYLE